MHKLLLINCLRRVTGGILLGVMLVISVGCNKMRAESNLDKAKARVEEAKLHNAETLVPQPWADVQSALTRTMTAIQSQDFGTALQSAKEANRISKDLLAQSLRAHAESLRAEASAWIERIQKNQVQSRDQAMFERIGVENGDGSALYDKGKFKQSIEVFSKVITDAKFMLNDLKTKADAVVDSIHKQYDELQSLGAGEYSPEALQAIKERVDQIDNLMVKEFNYKAIVELSDQVTADAANAILHTKQSKSNRLLADIETNLGTAFSLGANVFNPQAFVNISGEYEKALALYEANNYDSVLLAVEPLSGESKQLIESTKREAARVQFDTLSNRINLLSDNNVNDYFPGEGGVDQIRGVQAQAKEFLDQQQWVESRQASERALEMAQALDAKFDAKALEVYNEANEAVQSASGVYDTMSATFDRKSPAVEPKEINFERTKHTLKSELHAKLGNAEDNITQADTERQRQAYGISIQASTRAKELADEVIQQTYRVVTHNAIVEIAAQLTSYERLGGRQYAEAEVKKTQDLIVQARSLIDSENYRDAVKYAADAKVQLEVLKQELARTANRQIQTAEDAIKQAQENRADEFGGPTFNAAMSSLDAAKTAIEKNSGSVRKAIDDAIAAEELAKKATDEAAMYWAQERMACADALLPRIKEAGVQSYAPSQYYKAMDLYKNTQQLYSQGDYERAAEVANQTIEALDNALYAKVIEAESLVTEARRVPGFRFEPKELTEAIVSSQNAREALDQGDYMLSQQHSANAIMKARGVLRDTKQKGFDTRMNELTELANKAEHSGAGPYQSHEIAALISDMNRLRCEYKEYSYDELAHQADQIEARLMAVMDATPSVFKDLVGTFKERMAALELRKASNHIIEKVERAERKIKYMQIDFDAGKYRASFADAVDASRLMDEIELNLDERDYDKALNTELRLMTDNLKKYEGVINMGSSMLMELIITTHGRARALSITQQIKPGELHDTINQIAIRIRKLDAPVSRKLVKNQAIDMCKMIQAGSANFEKLLILDHYSEKDAKKIVQTAFDQLYRGRMMLQSVQRALQYPDSDPHPPVIQRVVSSGGK